MFIIESIHRGGIVHTNQFEITRRLQTPHAGDIVDFGDYVGQYPFLHSRYGRIDNIGKYKDGAAMICCELGSAFLLDNGNVSISGGPFETVDLSCLEPTMGTHAARFWNWGNNSPGAGMGVDYVIHRPLFRLINWEKKHG